MTSYDKRSLCGNADLLAEGIVRLIPSFYALTSDFSWTLRGDHSNYSLKLLSSLYLMSWDFDENWYIESNEDLHDALPSDTFNSGQEHFRQVGYFEGRLPRDVRVDEDWYLGCYPDVAKAVISGALVDCHSHFMDVGYREGRLPADPELDQDWYASRYMGGPERRDKSLAACLEHYMLFGYRNGALPSPNVR